MVLGETANEAWSLERSVKGPRSAHEKGGMVHQ